MITNITYNNYNYIWTRENIAQMQVCFVQLCNLCYLILHLSVLQILLYLCIWWNIFDETYQLISVFDETYQLMKSVSDLVVQYMWLILAYLHCIIWVYLLTKVNVFKIFSLLWVTYTSFFLSVKRLCSHPRCQPVNQVFGIG